MNALPITDIALPSYVLVSPARNEESTLEGTIQSVVSQTVLPLRWVIVSDGSHDRTEEIAAAYCGEHDWMRLVRLREHENRDFAAKVEAFNAGFRELVDLDFDIVGNLDADITFGPDYFEYLLGQFSRHPHLGVAGTPFVEDGTHYDYRFTSIEHVSGACQLFRHACFTEIGGYEPIAGGGIDWTAVTKARMQGWMTRSYTDRLCHHHRPMGTGTAAGLTTWARRGRKDYTLGGHPLWQVSRSVYQMTRKPYLLGGTLLLGGYLGAAISRAGHSVSPELVAFNRHEQMMRLRRFVADRVPGRASRNGAGPAVAGAPRPLGPDALGGSLRGIENWVESHDYRGWEPFDGLCSYLRVFTRRSLLLDRVLMQVVRRSPVNLRPLLGIRPLESTIGRGYMARGYLRRYRTTGDAEYRVRAERCMQWLIENPSPDTEEYAWGKHFDFASRIGRYPKLAPITVWTALIGMAFLEAYEQFGTEQYLDVATSSARWMMSLPRNQTPRGVCVSYTARSEMGSTIHNHNMLAAAFLARTAALLRQAGRGGTEADSLRALADGAMEYSCSHQHRDGSWFYGEEPKYAWIDNFHTGYNLDALRVYLAYTDDRRYAGALERGLRFYIAHFFEPGGAPRYYHDRRYPVDSQCIAQAIDTLACSADTDPRALPKAQVVAGWAISRMRGRDGQFYFRRYRGGIVVRTPMLHWAQASMYKALAELEGREASAVTECAAG